MLCQVNGESLLGTRHKRAVDIIKSLHDSALFLICDGYNNADIPQTATAKVNQGQEFGSQGHAMVAEEAGQGHGRPTSGREPQFQGHKIVTDEVSQSYGLTVQGHDVEQEKVSQGHAVQCQGHEAVMDKVGQGQGLVFEGHVKVNGEREPTADEQHRERARQRRLARYLLNEPINQ